MKNSGKFDAVRVNSAPEVLVDQIIKQIKSGKLKPSEVLPSQRELARMFGVGLGSIREAIKELLPQNKLEQKTERIELDDVG